MASSMKIMTVTMPLFSVFIAFSFQVGVGIYWIASAVFRTITMVIANKVIDRKGIDKIIEENKAKAKKKAEKRGDNPSKFEEYAKMSTRKYEDTQVKRKSIKDIANTSTEKINSPSANKNAAVKNTNANKPSDQKATAAVSDSKAKKKGKKGESENANIAQIANMLSGSNYNTKNRNKK